MDFMVRVLKVRGAYNALWVIVNQLTKSTHFSAIKDIISTY